MIHNSVLLVLFLVGIEAAVLYISSRPLLKKYFKFIPPVFWIYFLPMLASTFGIIDSNSPVYAVISSSLLPAALVLLLLSTDIRAILKLERPALIMMFAGSLGIMVATPLAFYLAKHWIGPSMWSGFGALSASWIGGSANMVAVKEALGTPDAVFTPMVIVDTVVPYVWMGLLVIAAGFAPAYDRWNGSSKEVLDSLNRKIQDSACAKQELFDPRSKALIIVTAVCGAIASYWLAKYMPVSKQAITTYAWTIIVASLLGVILSFTPVRRLESHGASKFGYFVLYFVLTSIGARASFSHIGPTVLLILAGFLIIIVHAIVLIVVGRLIRAPMFLLAVASQANVGGVASAPVVAAIYEPGLASVGLLLAIVGNITGTYLGFITGQLCHWASFH